MPRDISMEIKTLLDDNKIDDLKRFLNKRKCLNTCNMCLLYLFHTVQSVGILTTTIAAGYNIKELVWVGVGLNILASLINIFEHNNNSMSKRLLKDIEAIRDDKYVDEGTLVESDKDNNSTKSDTSKTPVQINKLQKTDTIV